MNAPNDNPMAVLDTRAAAFAKAREHLATLVAALNEGIEALQRSHMPKIRKAVATASAAEAELKTVLEANPGLFTKPRSTILHGIKVGYQQQKATLEMGPKDTLVERIERHLPMKADDLIQTKKTPIADALKRLSDAELSRIGARRIAPYDTPLIAPVDSAVDKAVEALLSAARDVGEEV